MDRPFLIPPLATLWQPEHSWWLLRTTPRFKVVVMPRLLNDRLLLLDANTVSTDTWNGHGAWCYQAGGRAIVCGWVFDPETEEEPAGWFKKVDTEGYAFAQPGAPTPTPYDLRRAR